MNIYGERTIQAIRKFEEYHRLNPHIYDKVKEYSLQVHATGRQHFGIRQIWERLRWYVMIESNDPNSVFRLCNNYTPFYARKLMADVPELKGFFTLRERKGIMWDRQGFPESVTREGAEEATA